MRIKISREKEKIIVETRQERRNRMKGQRRKGGKGIKQWKGGIIKLFNSVKPS